MAIKRIEDIDLSPIVAGTPVIYPLGEAFGNMVSAEIAQDTVSLSGVICKLVESNSGASWIDILEDEDDSTSTIEATTGATSDEVFLATDFVELQYIGLSVDVAAPTTGNLQVLFNSRGS